MRDQLSPAEAGSTQRRDEGAPLGARPRRLGRLALPALAAASAVALLGGCSGDSGTAAVAKSSKPPTVEKLASALKCKADIQKKVEDYRLGVCKSGKTTYTFVTFKDNRAKRGWLDYSKDYGGTYLVGSRWLVVTVKPSKLGPIQAKYGGTIERGRAHGGHGRS
ncbi:hypothetical protein [Streptomyces sp. WMMB 322]|uniref:hypothetical protein n=1 Tax=Streptomyces sp. WMMB 322 TaxID=1286821 RepID=UPI0008239B3B|nr:hypothetical protein [Streptomyces sp. WMMB 322]SCK09957.1 hypothetical protein H180DRAFT_00514 [Streptomyces sp. WMMB 322]